MKKLHILAVPLLLSFLVTAAVGQQHMIHTYWHQLDGPYWIYKLGGISVAGDFSYSFGSNNDDISILFRSTDNGDTWDSWDRSDFPANSISACATTGIDAYYTSDGIDVFNTTNAGSDWNGSQTPPANTSFSVCAANPGNQSIALTGCAAEGQDETLQKTTDHGATWVGLSGYGNYPVLDIAWHPSIADKFYVGLDGIADHCFYLSTDGGDSFQERSPENVESIHTFGVKVDGSTTHIVVVGYSSTLGWKILKTTNEGTNWDEISLPAGTYTEIRDLVIKGFVGGNANFLVATDGGIYEFNSQSQPGIWREYYIEAMADTNVLSLEISDVSLVFAGTLHGFYMKHYSDQQWDYKTEVMFKADLKALWADGDGRCYSLNKKTGLIFALDLDFSQRGLLQELDQFFNFTYIHD